MQLVAYGAQDIYLTGNPQITFFKVVYRRHTNFSMETIQQTISGTSITSQSSTTTGTVTISRNGDLVHKVYVHLNVRTGKHAGTVSNGLALVNQVELEIGGQKIDKQTLEWNEIYAELFVPNDKGTAFGSMVGTHDTNDHVIYIPLNFWFCRNPGLALPLIALQYHEVKLKFTWGSTTALEEHGTGKAKGSTGYSPEVWCDYIYLDTDERRRFAQVSHEYLIEQIQIQSATESKTQKLNFNHPVKELIWTQHVTESLGDVKLQLNGHDRFAAQDEAYFQRRQPYEYHTAVPNGNLDIHENAGGVDVAGLTYDVVATPADVTTTTKIHAYWTATNAFKSKQAQTVVSSSQALNAKTKNLHYCVVTFYKDDVAEKAIKKKQVLDWINADVAANAADVLLKNMGNSTTKSGKKGTLKSHTDTVSYQFSVPTGGGTTKAGAISANVVGNVVNFKVGDKASRGTGHALHEHGMSSKTNFSHNRKVNVYSFALKPEEHQPSGTCNFSRIDNAKLISDNALSTDDNIYAVNYNVLRIMSGMGGLAYSN